MEPVPETERMEEFRSSPLPTVRLQNAPPMAFASPPPPPPPHPPRSSSSSSNKDKDLDATPRRPPPSLYRSTEPSSPSSPALSPTLSPSWSPAWSPSPAVFPFRPRTASPLSGSHMRSRSTASATSLSLPGMARTQSMPGVNGSGHLQFGSDPRASMSAFGTTTGHRPPPALVTRTPRKTLVEDVYPLSPTRESVFQDTDRPLHERSSAPNLGLRSVSPSTPASLASLPLVRTRRPSSPYRRISSGTPPPSTSSASAPALAYIAELPNASSTPTPPAAPASTSAASSPLHRPSDALLSAPSYGSLGLLSSSSIPSTPTSTRSRSPSISSLETIPDSPDAEEAALEAERIAQLKAAAESAENGDGKGRNSLDAPTRGRTLAFGSRDKRKRWSVCGAERRGDLDLETIWED